MGGNIITVYHGSDKIIEKPEFDNIKLIGYTEAIEDNFLSWSATSNIFDIGFFIALQKF